MEHAQYARDPELKPQPYTNYAPQHSSNFTVQLTEVLLDCNPTISESELSWAFHLSFLSESFLNAVSGPLLSNDIYLCAYV